MSYDIATKVLIERCHREILRRFVGLDVLESVLLEPAPQETASVRRSDFPVSVTEVDGRQSLVLLEVQSRWERMFPLRLLEYRCRHMLKEKVDVISCVLLLTPSTLARDVYEDAEVRYQYRIIRIYELEAETMIEEGALCMLPFVPLMRGGIELTNMADRLIYESDLPAAERGEMLTSMALLSGLVSKELPQRLLSSRRDIMVESVAYELIRKEGLEQGLERGLEQGLERGLERGLEQGREQGLEMGLEQGLQDAIAFALDLRFGAAGLRLLPEIDDIHNVGMLRAIMEHLKTANSPESVRSIYAPEEQ